MDADRTKSVQSRIKRIAGQVTGVQRMIDEKRYCIDVLQQISAIRSALDALGVELLTQHLQNCILPPETSECGESHAHPQAQAMSREQLLDELQYALSQFLK
ncbi:metal-sensitive transcriptional regulator [Tuwongella immobilis]|uniref:Uncharacterized protein n=1 Tax=Tuwongella immobilis TaxID=692036 RepID=A0A6C2YLE3_9BACT|nr:metal-sensitive transcriptional regulator [Tuwongella immobilis]VIP02246.1 copper-sensing transcriptional repressor : Uncharacterized protein OS=Geobacter sp. (strain M18) GN=GM18_2069 PE=4 SV=1: Trns_repr_metal [Tuwongella immobilis]VTS00825.1 copper-sensing transcriptional repressor : Uncharacterized protein OS=Geobacter sp. (strain M18) GN=GM18_2069 PE=4 SV=1: Trns_repr_metal [Tuwongella immobilis]